jgi:antitoxin ParD1/3/4
VRYNVSKEFAAEFKEETQMTITLTPEMEHLIQNKIQSGRFGSPSDVVYEGLRLLEQEETSEEIRFNELKRDIAIGIAQADNGQVKAFDAEDLKGRVRRELAKGE